MPEKSGEYDHLLVFLAYSPVYLHGLGGLSYTWRWTHYYLLTTTTTPQEKEQAHKLVVINKTAFIILIMINIGSIICVTTDEEFIEASTIFLIAFYISVAVSLIVVINLFLYKLKSFIYFIYQRKKFVIRLYSYLIAGLMVSRSISILVDYIILKTVTRENHHLMRYKINDVQNWVFHFLELTPSFIIIVVLWKSNNEMRDKLSQSSKSKSN